MKRFFLLVMSALSLIALSVIVAFGWSASTATTWVTTPTPHWISGQSASVQATTSTGWVGATAPATGTGVNCQVRRALAVNAAGQEVADADCPLGSGAGTPKCCLKEGWNPTLNASYRTVATQTSNTLQACGPTTAQIADNTVLFGPCSDDGPDGE